MKSRLVSCLSLSLSLALAGLAACAAPVAAPEAATETASETAPVPGLEKLWTAENFLAPEGVVQLPDGNYLVSNVGTDDGAEKNGDGYISKMSPDGALIERYWAAKVNGPKGLALMDGTVYAADIDAVVQFDAEKGGLGEKIRVDGRCS